MDSDTIKQNGMTAERLKELLTYDPVSGVFRWRVGRGRQRASSIAGTISVRKNGRAYVRINISGKIYSAHRLAFLFMTGVWPPNEVDHARGDGTDNSWANLRLATKAQNQGNRRKSRNNTTGFKSVSVRANGRFYAYIMVNGKQKHLGYFDSPELAHAAYCAAAEKQFGPFARVN